MAGPGGFKPVFDKDGNYLGPITQDIMADPGYQPTMRELLQIGVGKAHRQIVSCHYEMRNFDRSSLGTTGKVQ